MAVGGEGTRWYDCRPWGHVVGNGGAEGSGNLHCCTQVTVLLSRQALCWSMGRKGGSIALPVVGRAGERCRRCGPWLWLFGQHRAALLWPPSGDSLREWKAACEGCPAHWANVSLTERGLPTHPGTPRVRLFLVRGDTLDDSAGPWGSLESAVGVCARSPAPRCSPSQPPGRATLAFRRAAVALAATC